MRVISAEFWTPSKLICKNMEYADRVDNFCTSAALKVLTFSSFHTSENFFFMGRFFKVSKNERNFRDIERNCRKVVKIGV